jgi:ketosteroid isomerase-like protein
MMPLLPVLLAAAAPAAAAADPAAPLREADLAMDRAVAAHDAAAFRALLDDEAWFTDDGTFAQGAQAAFASWAALLKDGAPSLRWHPEESGADGDLGWTLGRYVMTARGADGKEKKAEGRYFTVWRRAADGRWRALQDGPFQPPTGPVAQHRMLRIVHSSDGALEYEAGETVKDGKASGVYFTVRRRAPGGAFDTVKETLIPAR